MKLIIGLGNPGRKYANTRHNIGFMVLDELARALGCAVDKKHCRSLVGQGFSEGQKVLLAKPQTFMNNSGEAVLELLNYYQDSMDDLIVIHDDLDLEFGRIRFKTGGGTGGHNGLKSISHYLNSPDYDRLKIGIGRPKGFMQVESYVLSEFSSAEAVQLPKIIAAARDGLIIWAREGIRQAMNDLNGLDFRPEDERAGDAGHGNNGR